MLHFCCRYRLSWSQITCKINSETRWYVCLAFLLIQYLSYHYISSNLFFEMLFPGWKYDLLVHLLHPWSAYVSASILPRLDESERESWIRVWLLYLKVLIELFRKRLSLLPVIDRQCRSFLCNVFKILTFFMLRIFLVNSVDFI